MLKEKEIAN